MGVPQGSPLYPVLFLIWIAPILEKMAKKINVEAGRIRGGGQRWHRRGRSLRGRVGWCTVRSGMRDRSRGDSEVAGMAGGLTKVRREKKVLILADSKAAIAAVRKAGRTGKTRSRHLREVINRIAEVKEEGGKSN